MKRYKMLMIEWNIESLTDTQLHEMDELTGASIGAGVGALGTGGVWAAKRLQLWRKMKSCNGEPTCVQYVQNEIANLRNSALKGGIAATAGGAAVGAAAGNLALTPLQIYQRHEDELTQMKNRIGMNNDAIALGQNTIKSPSIPFKS